MTKRKEFLSLLLMLGAAYTLGHLMGGRPLYRYLGATTSEAIALDPDNPGLKARVDCGRLVVTYDDGTAVPADALGVAVITAEDYKKFPDRLDRHGIRPNSSDYPVVAFFNSTGFDATGDPVAVRRGKDGLLIHGKPDARKPVHAVVADRGGGFRVVAGNYSWKTYDDKMAWRTVDDKEWFKDFMNIEPPVKLPTPEEMDRMTDAELEKLGVRRMDRGEYEKKFGKLPTPPADQAKTGLRGRVVKVGGSPALQPVKAKVQILAGKARPSDKLDTVVATIATEADGSYAASLPPGTYTVVVEYEGKLRGNALDQSAWPSVDVKDGWVDYDVRVR
jgi:hypothetical protein